MATTENVLTRFSGILASVSTLDTLRERLSETSRIMLGANGVVITSETVPDGRITVSSTQPLSEQLGALQTAVGEGPMIDALRTGAVVVGDFGSADGQWPVLRRLVSELDFTGTLIAIPLRSDLALHGVLLAHRDSGSLETDADDARFLGNAIGTAVLQDPALGAQGHVFAEVLSDRDLVRRATGILEVEASIRYQDALALLRALAFSRGEELGAVAKGVIDGDVCLCDTDTDVTHPRHDRG